MRVTETASVVNVHEFRQSYFTWVNFVNYFEMHLFNFIQNTKFVRIWPGRFPINIRDFWIPK